MTPPSPATEAMSTDSPGARELTHRLVAHAAPSSDAPDGAVLAVQAACERTYRELTRSLGANGSHALLTRAIAQARTQHPLLGELHVGRQSEPDLEGVTAMVQAHGSPAVVAALEAVLETLLGLLGRLIGNDMVARLVERSAPTATQDDGDMK